MLINQYVEKEKKKKRLQGEQWENSQIEAKIFYVNVLKRRQSNKIKKRITWEGKIKGRGKNGEEKGAEENRREEMRVETRKKKEAKNETV